MPRTTTVHVHEAHRPLNLPPPLHHHTPNLPPRCTQFGNFPVVYGTPNGTFQIKTVQELLPDAFVPEDLSLNRCPPLPPEQRRVSLAWH